MRKRSIPHSFEERLAFEKQLEKKAMHLPDGSSKDDVLKKIAQLKPRLYQRVAEIAGPATSKIATATGSVQITSELLDIFPQTIGILLDEPQRFIGVGGFRLRRD